MKFLNKQSKTITERFNMVFQFQTNIPQQHFRQEINITPEVVSISAGPLMGTFEEGALTDVLTDDTIDLNLNPSTPPIRLLFKPFPQVDTNVHLTTLANDVPDEQEAGGIVR